MKIGATVYSFIDREICARCLIYNLLGEQGYGYLNYNHWIKERIAN